MTEPKQTVDENIAAQPETDVRGLLDVSVLVVDDVEDNLDLIEELLVDDVWSVLRAQSGESAVRLALECPPDVLLLDLMMPRMNGLAVLRAIRSRKSLERTPVILQTAHADRETIITARRLGCSRFLCKPLTKDRLLAEMNACLQSRPRRVVCDYEPFDERTRSQKMRELNMTLTNAKTLMETAKPADDPSQPNPAGCFRNLIPDESAIGKRLIRVANSPAYGGRYPARTVAEAVVRIGVRETNTLMKKVSSTSTREVSQGNVIKALDFLEILAALFPDRTSTPDGTLSLLEELNTAVHSDRSVAAAADTTDHKESASWL